MTQSFSDLPAGAAPYVAHASHSVPDPRAPRFGVNYVPSKNWWYSWGDWDLESIRQDLTAIAGLGMDHIRIHCLWPYFQPNPSYISQAMLDRTLEILDAAADAGLDVEITALNGWLSGFTFYPAWKGSRNFFTDPDMIDAEKYFLEVLASAVVSHKRFMGLDLGNEVGALTWQDPVSPEDADTWQREMFACCNKFAPGKMHVNGVDHLHWFHDVGFTPEALTSAGTVTCLHTWVRFTGALDLYGPLDVGSIHLPEFCVELARAFHRDPERPLWVQEFGMSAEWMPSEGIPEFAERTVRAVLDCHNVWGLTWWSSHDIDHRFSGFSELEYDLGLLDVNNQVKPVGRRIAALIEEFKNNPLKPSHRDHAVVFPADRTGWSKPDDLPSASWVYANLFMKLIQEHGIRPAIVLDTEADSDSYLKSRGITTLHRV